MEHRVEWTVALHRAVQVPSLREGYKVFENLRRLNCSTARREFHHHIFHSRCILERLRRPSLDWTLYTMTPHAQRPLARHVKIRRDDMGKISSKFVELDICQVREFGVAQWNGLIEIIAQVHVDPNGNKWVWCKESKASQSCRGAL